MDNDDVLLLERDAQSWRLRCDSNPELVSQANAYLGYLADRNYLTAPAGSTSSSSGHAGTH